MSIKPSFKSGLPYLCILLSVASAQAEGTYQRFSGTGQCGGGGSRSSVGKAEEDALNAGCRYCRSVGYTTSFKWFGFGELQCHSTLECYCGDSGRGGNGFGGQGGGRAEPSLQSARAASLLTVAYTGTDSTAASVPAVERWEPIQYPADSNNDSRDRGQVFIHWHRDPQRHGYQGMVLYRLLADGAVVPFIKAWSMRETSDGLDFSGALTALQLEDGAWVVGEPGERLDTHREYDTEGMTVSITYRFNGPHRPLSRTIVIAGPAGS